MALSAREWAAGSRKVQQIAALGSGMDGKGCWVENVFVDRLSRSLKYDEVYF
jgi:hypothetical protein